MVIGKSRNPRCFSKISADKLRVSYRNKKKAWMTTGIFEDWLKSFDQQMRKEKRNVLLFVDNATSHPTLQMNNVKLQFLPANTTSVCQPMDQDIIQAAAKLKYRKRQLQYVISEMDQNVHMCGTELLKQMSVLDAIFWIRRLGKKLTAPPFRSVSSSPVFSLSENLMWRLMMNRNVQRITTLLLC